MATHASLPVETVPISRLFCSPTNPRNNDAAIPHVAVMRWHTRVPVVEPGSTISDPNERPADGTPDSTAVPIPQQGGVPGKQSHRQPIWRQEVVRSGPARPKRAEVPKAEVPKVEVPKFELPQQE